MIRKKIIIIIILLIIMCLFLPDNIFEEKRVKKDIEITEIDEAPIVQAAALNNKQETLSSLQQQVNSKKQQNDKENIIDIYESNADLYTSQSTSLFLEPNNYSEVLKTLDEGITIETLGLTENNYVKCKVNDIEGYIKAEHLKEPEPVIIETGNKGEYQRYAWSLFESYGWTVDDFNCLVKLWNRESNWNPSAKNSSSGAYGIPQSLPANKMASEGDDYLTNYQTQIKWGLKYISGRYGTPTQAWAHSERTGWY